MMRRYALRDDQWERIEDLLPGREGRVGATAKDNRLFVEADIQADALLAEIMTYRFEQLSRREIESMLDITLKETRVYREIKEEGREEGREATANIITRLLTKRFGELPQDVRSAIVDLSLPVLEELGEALLDFTSVADLQAWLEAR